jgi:hypothetical protein
MASAECNSPPSKVYDWRDQDAEFAQAWADARKDCIERIEKTMDEKALSGETLAGHFMLSARARPCCARSFRFRLSRLLPRRLKDRSAALVAADSEYE